MSNNQLIEQRLADLEAAVAELRNKMATPRSSNWIEAITGTISDTEAFDEALTYGREFRRGGRPPEQAEGDE